MPIDAIPDVKNLSDRRLWETLRLGESRDPRVSQCLLGHARGELRARGQHSEGRRVRAPR